MAPPCPPGIASSASEPNDHGLADAQVASLFFWLAAFSVPYIKSIYYVRTRENDVKYGNFGWCALSDTVCYRNVG